MGERDLEIEGKGKGVKPKVIKILNCTTSPPWWKDRGWDID